MSTTDDWMRRVIDELTLGDAVDAEAVRDTLLDLARDVAHGVDRPATPITTFLLGVAVGRSEDPHAALGEYATIIRALVESWPD